MPEIIQEMYIQGILVYRYLEWWVYPDYHPKELHTERTFGPPLLG